MKLQPNQRDEARQIAHELARSADILPGTITERHTRCGRPNCACHRDPPRLHGPYWHWTRKIKNKTVGRYLTQPQADESQRWTTTTAASANSSHASSRSASNASTPTNTAPKRTPPRGPPALGRDQAATQTTNHPQTPKREDLTRIDRQIACGCGVLKLGYA